MPDRDAELSRRYKDPYFKTPQYRPRRVPPAGPVDPVVLSEADRELYWRSLLADPFLRNQNK